MEIIFIHYSWILYMNEGNYVKCHVLTMKPKSVCRHIVQCFVSGILKIKYIYIIFVMFIWFHHSGYYGTKLSFVALYLLCKFENIKL